MLRQSLLLALFSVVSLAQTNQKETLCDGRDETGRRQFQDEIGPGDSNRYLKQLFPMASPNSVKSYGTRRGSFTAAGHEQVLVSAFQRDSVFSGSSAQSQGVAVLAVFEGESLITRYQTEGDPIVLLGVRDLDDDGLSESLCVSTWQGAGVGEETFQVWSANGQHLRIAYKQQIYWYSFLDRRELASKVIYLGGNIRKRASYRVAQYHREMQISTPRSAPTSEKPWRER